MSSDLTRSSPDLADAIVLSVVVRCNKRPNRLDRFIPRALAVLDELAIAAELLIVHENRSRGALWERILQHARADGRVRTVGGEAREDDRSGFHAGLAAAGGELICLMDAARRHRPEEIPRLYKTYLRELPDLVQAVCQPVGRSGRLLHRDGRLHFPSHRMRRRAPRRTPCRTAQQPVPHAAPVSGLDSSEPACLWVGESVRDGPVFLEGLRYLRNAVPNFVLGRRDVLENILPQRASKNRLDRCMGPIAALHGYTVAHVSTQLDSGRATGSLARRISLWEAVSTVRDLLALRLEARAIARSGTTTRPGRAALSQAPDPRLLTGAA